MSCANIWCHSRCKLILRGCINQESTVSHSKTHYKAVGKAPTASAVERFKAMRIGFHLVILYSSSNVKSRNYRGIHVVYSKSIVQKNNDKFGKGLVSTSRTYSSPKGTGPGVRRSKRPLSACHSRRKCSIETTQNSVKGRVRYKV